MVHELKIYPMYFREVKSGAKPFEVRKNDRDYKVGDELLLKEFVPVGYYEDENKEYYTGEICHRKITYVLKGGDFGIEKGTAVLGLQVV
ncbi:MAG: DUF3850 domain-containing protein [Candidatus Anammoxibacter sp.]